MRGYIDESALHGTTGRVVVSMKIYEGASCKANERSKL